MSGYRVQIEASGDLAMAPNAEAGYSTATHLYVPGHVLLGALAAHWIRAKGIPDGSNADRNEFCELFHGSLRYGPSLAEDSYIEPVSFRARKTAIEGGEDNARDAAHQGDYPSDVITEDGKGAIKPVRPDVRLDARVTRTQLETVSGQRERAQQGQLFSRRAIKRKTKLHGTIVGRHPWLRAIADDPDGLRIWLGGRKSTNGRATVRLTPGLPDPVDAHGSSGEAGQETVIRLTSPGLFVDDEARPVLNPADRDWARVFAVEGATLIQSWVRPQRIGGWHAASGLPRPEELAATPGSTYRLRIPAGAAAEWPERLRQFGLGLRTSEGFGFAEQSHEPWVTPAAPDTAADEGAGVENLKELMAPLRNDESLRSWSLALLQDVARDKRAGRSVTTLDNEANAPTDDYVEQLVKRAAVRRLNETQRDALRDLAQLDLTQLKDALVLLDDANPATSSSASSTSEVTA